MLSLARNFCFFPGEWQPKLSGLSSSNFFLSLKITWHHFFFQCKWLSINAIWTILCSSVRDEFLCPLRRLRCFACAVMFRVFPMLLSMPALTAICHDFLAIISKVPNKATDRISFPQHNQSSLRYGFPLTCNFLECMDLDS